MINSGFGPCSLCVTHANKVSFLGHIIVHDVWCSPRPCLEPWVITDKFGQEGHGASFEIFKTYFIFKSNFRFITKLRGRHRKLPYTCQPPTHAHPSPASAFPTEGCVCHSGWTCVDKSPSPRVYSSHCCCTLWNCAQCVVHCVGLDKWIMTRTLHLVPHSVVPLP